VLHAPRQTGKTSYLHALRDYLNKQGQYKSLHINIETAQAARENVREGMRTVLRILAEELFIYLKDSFLKERWKQILEESGEFYALQDALMQWCRASEIPIVLFIDEVDSLVGSTEPEKITDDDIDYVVDLGLIQKKPYLRIANRIYQEIIPRQLTYSTELTMTQEASWYVEDDGTLDMDKLLRAFQDFFRKHFESWVDGFNYAEAGPQLLLQAYLQRIVNGGGRVEREYGLGRQRTDLLLIWPYKNGECIQQVVVELKLRYGRLEKTIENGLEQTWQYMDKCGTNEGYLLVFDRSGKASWKEKIFKKEKTFKNTRIVVYGM
jgi:hypothetical protein